MELQKLYKKITKARSAKPCDFCVNKKFIKNLPQEEQITYWRTGKLGKLREDRFLPFYPEKDPYDLQMFESTALVGSSGALKGSRCQKEIDDHSNIIRINKAPTQEYKEDVGKRTDIRFSLGTLKYKENDETLIRSYRRSVQPEKDLKNNVFEEFNIYVHTHRFSQYVQTFKQNERKICSTGFLAFIFSLLTSKRVTLYGFNLPNESTDFNFHYFDNVEYVEDSHNFKNEHKFYKFLNKKSDFFEWKKL